MVIGEARARLRQWASGDDGPGGFSVVVLLPSMVVTNAVW